MVNIGIIGVGFVGSELINQIKATGYKSLKIVGLSSSKKLLLSDTSYTALDLNNWKTDLQDNGIEANLDILAKYLSDATEHSIIVDCSASDIVAGLYPTWLKSGLSVVAANKKGIAGDLSLYKSIQSLSGNLNGTGKAPFTYFESSVGAGLPVLNTLSDLVKTGDKIEKIEGIFSGTLSYLFNKFSTLSGENTGTFSDAVKTAKNLGYTEPDPRDDLNGVDVARKVKK